MKGFTLIELLGVITIIAVLGLITIPIIVNLLSGSKTDTCLAQKELIRKAAKNYSTKNPFLLPEAGQSQTVTLATLIDEGFIEGNTDLDRTDSGIKNPKTGEYVSLTMITTITNAGTSTKPKYTYTVPIDCN